jgi:hypothetical protein
MPRDNLRYALATADLIMAGAKARSMAAHNRASLLGNAVRSIPGNIGQLVQLRDARAQRTKQDQLFDIQRTNAELEAQRSMRDYADEQATRDVFRLIPKLPMARSTNHRYRTSPTLSPTATNAASISTTGLRPAGSQRSATSLVGWRGLTIRL